MALAKDPPVSPSVRVAIQSANTSWDEAILERPDHSKKHFTGPPVVWRSKGLAIPLAILARSLQVARRRRVVRQGGEADDLS